MIDNVVVCFVEGYGDHRGLKGRIHSVPTRRSLGLTVGGRVAVNMRAGRVAEPVLRLAGRGQQFQGARVGVARLGDILNTPAEIVFSPSRSALPQIRGAIAFDDVTFRYRPGGREVLQIGRAHV